MEIFDIIIFVTFCVGCVIGCLWYIYLDTKDLNAHKKEEDEYLNEPKMVLEVQEKWYKALLDGTKKCEGRKISPTYEHLKEKDIITITHDDGRERHEFDAVITKINKYPGNENNDSLNDYLLTEGVENCLPGVKTLEEARNIYLKWSTVKEIQKYGMMAIHILILER